ncbi:hypothetical protein EDF82_0279 [Raoultella sp. BIGb0399]|nr:hypothetical protein EDF82_0279 [Raoultella sp. BIGb0399]
MQRSHKGVKTASRLWHSKEHLTAYCSRADKGVRLACCQWHDRGKTNLFIDNSCSVQGVRARDGSDTERGSAHFFRFLCQLIFQRT